MKTCTKCGSTLPATLEFFHRHPLSSDGLKPRCKSCRRGDTAAYLAGLPDEAKAGRVAYATAWSRAHPARRAATSKKWSDAHRVERMGWREDTRARSEGKFVEAVSLPVLIKRDDGICGICDKPVAEGDESIDHILPFFHGGTHSYVNTQLAHLGCNARKRNRIDVEQLCYAS